LVNHDGLHPAIERNFSRAFAKFSDACFVHSNAAADAAAKQFWIPKSKLHVISHGNFIELYPNQIGRAEARHQLRLATEAKVFLFLGRIELYKGISDLIEAFRGMPDDCHLVLAGKVANLKLLPELERLAAGNPRIHLHPRRIPDDELQVFFNAADSVVLPFRQILTSGSLILAMGYGKVLVVPRIASLQEIVPSGGAVWFDPLDPTSLATALQEAAAAQPSAGGERNHHAALQWDWKKIASEIVRRASREGE
jgi:glycosyltransferase involved in cell wall biosynthesis